MLPWRVGERGGVGEKGGGVAHIAGETRGQWTWGEGRGRGNGEMRVQNPTSKTLLSSFDFFRLH